LEIGKLFRDYSLVGDRRFQVPCHLSRKRER
jgi:hypothetical protein